MYLLPLLVLAFSVFCLGYGLWLGGYWDLYPFLPDETTVFNPPDEDLPFFDRVTLGPPVAWSLLIHVGIVGVLLLVGDIPQGIRRFPARDRMATRTDFYVFMASLPDEEKHPPKASRSGTLQSPLQAAVPTLPALTATRVAGLTMTKPPVPPRPTAASVASAGDSTNEGPSTEKVAKKRPAPAPLVHDAASRELSTAPERTVELFTVRALRPSLKQLEPAAPLPAFTQDEAAPPTHSGPAPPSSQPTPQSTGTHLADLPAPKALTASRNREAAPRPPIPEVSLPTPEMKALASPPPDETLQEPEELPFDGLVKALQASEAPPKSASAPVVFPPPGTVIGARATTLSSEVSAAARPPTPQPPAGSQETHSVLSQAQETLPAPPIQEANARAERGPSPDTNLPEAEETPLAKFGDAPPAPEVAPHPPQEPVPDGLAVAAQPLEAGPALFPPPGTVVKPPLIASREIAPGLADGRGIGRLAVRLDGPRSRVTDHEIEAVSGPILGGVPVQLSLYVNGTAREVVADGGSFEVSVSLRRGLNHLRAVAKDWRGIETEDTIAVKYVPPPVPNGIAITSPPDGHILPPDTPPVILVEGQVEDWDVSTLWLVANNRRIAVRAHHGRFRKALPLLEPVLHMWAELPPNGGPPHRSRSVTVRAPSPSRSHVLLLLDWPEGVVGNQVEVKATWRASPERLDVPIRRVPIEVFGASTKETLPEVFSLRMKPGVYTFVLRARGMSASGVRATLVFPEGDHLKGRELKPVSLNGTRGVVLAKVLLPQGVLWEDDEWFTGQSESADTVTKFRFPEGISWTERKRDLQ